MCALGYHLMVGAVAEIHLRFFAPIAAAWNRHEKKPRRRLRFTYAPVCCVAAAGPGCGGSVCLGTRAAVRH
eukprot:COSAG01_NODE_23_length_37704_cov_30.005877_24_plen_71_part_00